MWKVLCSFLMLVGLSGGVALAWTSDNYNQLFGLYDARGWGFMASIIVFAVGLLLLLMSGSRRQKRAGHGNIGEDEHDDAALAVGADAPADAHPSRAASPPTGDDREAPRHPAFQTQGASKPH